MVDEVVDGEELMKRAREEMATWLEISGEYLSILSYTSLVIKNSLRLRKLSCYDLTMFYQDYTKIQGNGTGRIT